MRQVLSNDIAKLKIISTNIDSNNKPYYIAERDGEHKVIYEADTLSEDDAKVKIESRIKYLTQQLEQAQEVVDNIEKETRELL